MELYEYNDFLKLPKFGKSVHNLFKKQINEKNINKVFDRNVQLELADLLEDELMENYKKNIISDKKAIIFKKNDFLKRNFNIMCYDILNDDDKVSLYYLYEAILGIKGENIYEKDEFKIIKELYYKISDNIFSRVFYSLNDTKKNILKKIIDENKNTVFCFQKVNKNFLHFLKNTCENNFDIYKTFYDVLNKNYSGENQTKTEELRITLVPKSIDVKNHKQIYISNNLNKDSDDFIQKNALLLELDNFSLINIDFHQKLKPYHIKDVIKNSIKNSNKNIFIVLGNLNYSREIIEKNISNAKFFDDYMYSFFEPKNNTSSFKINYTQKPIYALFFMKNN